MWGETTYFCPHRLSSDSPYNYTDKTFRILQSELGPPIPLLLVSLWAGENPQTPQHTVQALWLFLHEILLLTRDVVLLSEWLSHRFRALGFPRDTSGIGALENKEASQQNSKPLVVVF